MLKALMERRAALHAALEALNTAAVNDKGEARSFNDAENTEFDAGMEEIRKLDERIAELQDAERRESLAAAHRVTAGTAGTVAAAVVTSEPEVYRRDSPENSYFKDLAAATLHGSGQARDRLVRNSAGQKEYRALGNTGAVGGSGGEFAPPEWLVNEFVALLRPARVFANLANTAPLPSGVSSLNIPKVLTGTTTAIQTTQNTALSQTDLTTGSVSSGISTIGGKQVVSQQLLDQSAIPFDRIILADLAADYAKQFGTQFIIGTGATGQLRGVGNAAGLGTTAYTQASPAVAGAGQFYATLAKAIAAVETARFMSPSAIVMHPRRWGWIAAAFDTQNRPLLPMSGVATNPVGTEGAEVAQGLVGHMQGLPVYVDANVPTNLGVGTNEDRVYVVRTEDLFVWESPLQMETFTQPYADSAGVLFRALAYSAAIPDRFGASINVIAGTGLVTPTY